MTIEPQKDPVRDAFTRCARILERLPDDVARERVVRAFVELLGLSAPKTITRTGD